MSAVVRNLMSVDEFLDFAEGRDGRWELEDGVAYAMAPERLAHADAKFAVVVALRAAIARAKLPCHAVLDGPAVRIDARTAFQPDALVYCGARLPGTAREVANPVIAVEVSSPSTRARDEGKKRLGYFSLPSVEHYLLVDPESSAVVYFARPDRGRVEPTTLREGALRLDPPGLDLAIEDLFAAA